MKPTDSRVVVEKMVQYLNTALPIKGAANEALCREVERFQTAEGKDGLDFIQPPHVEVSAEYKAAEESLKTLQDEDVLMPQTVKALSHYWGFSDADKWHLYEHQAKSIGALGHHPGNATPRNLVICTGTGSGKTESFLIPIVDAIIRERQAEGANYREHVRALILYPMNALVNDQVERLRKLLKGTPVTFGKYININETRQRATRVSIGPWSTAWTVERLNALPKDDARATDDGLLTNEYRYRNEWLPQGCNGGRGPADILITNFAMLERLMLLPDTNLFDDPWQFIVLDEAHSYTGSMGTEIAWLMRRLEHRLETKAAESNQELHLQYVAASATLSDSEVIEEKESAARKFAKEIFPIKDDASIAVEFGAYEAPAEVDSIPLPTVNGHEQTASEFARGNGQLIKDTKAYEEAKARFGQHADRISVLERVIADPSHSISAADLFALDWFFRNDLLNIDLDDESRRSVSVTDAIKCMVDLVLCRHSRSRTSDRKRNAWKEFLHDPLLHQPAVGPGNEKDYVGNRIGVYDIWQQIQRGRNEPVSYTVFYYLYLAVVDLVRDLDSQGGMVPVDFARLKCTLTDAPVQRMRAKLDQLRNDQADVKEKAIGIDQRWREVLPAPGETDASAWGYRERLYAALCQQSELVAFRAQVFKPDGVSPAEPKTFPRIAEACHVGEEDLQAVLELAGLAVAKGKRKPLVDVKYHQVVRDITDVGIYFENGDLSRPHLVRTEAEFASTDTKEKVFTLGVCRDCGQPYLLGYLDDRISSNGDMPQESMRAYRSKTNDYKYLHAFTLTEPKSIERAADDDFPKDRRRAHASSVYINLVTGELKRNAAEGFVELYWVLNPGTEANKEEFIAQCHRCGSRANGGREVRYGNVTPYEATGLQFKIHLLDAFASCAESDTDPEVVNTTVGGGRKVLAFSDSRSQASRLALNFELVKDSDFSAYLALLAIVEYKPRVEDDAEYITGLQGLSVASQFMNPEQIAAARTQLREEAEERLRRQGTPVLDSVIGLEPGFYAQVVRDAARGLFCPQLLEIEGCEVDGHVQFVDNPVVVAKYLFLQSLQESHRSGILSQGRVILSSRLVEELPDEVVQDRFCGTGIAAVSDARRALNEIYTTLVADRCICTQNDQHLPSSVESRHAKPLVSDAAFVGTARNAVFAKIVRSYRVAERSISAWLRQAWDIFRDADHNHENPLLVEYTRTVWRDGNQVRETGYALEFAALCEDMKVGVSEEGRRAVESRVLPFVIEEHTAQINSALGAVYQRAFAEGRINILSCSTTFEMGIDVGGLNNVFLGNLPPAASNYRQRAGRAGRRPGAPAYILSLASSRSSHDRNYYGNISELFFGKVLPPNIYLDRPVFAARHLRAEALHSFLVYLTAGSIARDWEWISHFLLGIDHEPRYDEAAEKNANGKQPYLGEVIKYIAPDCGPYGGLCQQNLDRWLESKCEEVQVYVNGICGISEVRFPEGYAAAEDLAFELLRRENETSFSPEALRIVGSARLPEGEGHESLDTKRMALYDRLMAELYYSGQSANALAVYNADDLRWLERYNEPRRPAEGGLNALQEDILDARTIDALSATCILPKYGFPSDNVRLLPKDDDVYAKGLKLERPLLQGMFEYAPGQTVTANKRLFKSEAARFTAWAGAVGEAHSEGAAGHADNAYKCRNNACGRIFKVSEVRMGLCPVCGNQVRSVLVVTPELFVSGYSKKGTLEVTERQGSRILQPDTDALNLIAVPRLALATAEPSSHTLRIINAGSRGDGFLLSGNENGRRALYLHEIRTDIAVWQVNQNLELPDWDSDRKTNAFLSAFYALKRMLAKKLRVSDRDIEGECLFQDGVYKFVFFDMASGGGGFVLSALMRDANDMQSAQLIREVVKEAFDVVSICGCQNGNEDNSRKPVTMAEYNTRQEGAGVRPAVSCYGCLREYSNQDKHQQLDRHDAAVVLQAILNPSQNPTAPQPPEAQPVQDVEEGEAVAVPEEAGFRLVGGVRFRLVTQEELAGRNIMGRVCLFQSGQVGRFTPRTNREDVIGLQED